jgi:hypothetical protein
MSVEIRDAKSLKALYAANAILTIIDTDNSPSELRTIKCAKDIGNFLDDVYGRDLRHTLEPGVLDRKHLAYLEGRSYPDGTHVIASTTAELGPNGIVKQTIVQAWDN